jgi:hypothetical protein
MSGMMEHTCQADIPSNYLCEIMADIMSDPVMFPPSRKVQTADSADAVDDTAETVEIMK